MLTLSEVHMVRPEYRERLYFPLILQHIKETTFHENIADVNNDYFVYFSDVFVGDSYLVMAKSRRNYFLKDSVLFAPHLYIFSPFSWLNNVFQNIRNMDSEILKLMARKCCHWRWIPS